MKRIKLLSAVVEEVATSLKVCLEIGSKHSVSNRFKH